MMPARRRDLGGMVAVGDGEVSSKMRTWGQTGVLTLSLSFNLKQKVEEQKRERKVEQEEWARKLGDLERLVREREQRIRTLEEEAKVTRRCPCPSI